MATDWELLQRFAQDRDQGAFAQLVQAYIGFVHATACRILGAQKQDAEDVTQAVFLLLSRKAARIPRRGSLAGWLFLATRWCCAEVKRAQGRRRKHEREAAMNRPDAQVAPEDIRPLLDDALARLGDKERQAILVRYLEGKTAAETGAVLGVSAEAVEKRLERGIGKLRAVFARQGFVVPAAGLAGVMLAESAKAAPAGLGLSVASAAGGSASEVAVSIAKGAGAMMKMAMVKTAVAGLIVLALLLAGGTVILAQGRAGAKPKGATEEAQPATRHSAAPPATRAADAGPLDAVRAFNKGLETFDTEALFARIYAQGPDEIAVKEDQKDVFTAGAEFRNALAAKFGQPAVAQLLGAWGLQLISEEKLKQADVQVTGNQATVKIPQEPEPPLSLPLVRDGGVWKVKLSVMLGKKIGPDDDLARIHAIAVQRVARFDAVRTEVKRGKFATLDAAEARLQEPLPPTTQRGHGGGE